MIRLLFLVGYFGFGWRGFAYWECWTARLSNQLLHASVPLSFSLPFSKVCHSFSSYNSPRHTHTIPLPFVPCPFQATQVLTCKYVHYLYLCNSHSSCFLVPFSLFHVTRNHCSNRNIHNCNFSLLYIIQHTSSSNYEVRHPSTSRAPCQPFY